MFWPLLNQSTAHSNLLFIEFLRTLLWRTRDASICIDVVGKPIQDMRLQTVGIVQSTLHVGDLDSCRKNNGRQTYAFFLIFGSGEHGSPLGAVVYLRGATGTGAATHLSACQP